jgi:hypothetical protein
MGEPVNNRNSTTALIVIQSSIIPFLREVLRMGYDQTTQDAWSSSICELKRQVASLPDELPRSEG